MSLNNNVQHWGIEALVAELREIRLQSLENRQRRDHPPKLPSRKILGHRAHHHWPRLHHWRQRLAHPQRSARHSHQSGAGRSEMFDGGAGI